MLKLYPPLEARKTGRMRVSDIHEIYWEESGNPNGLPVIAVHGGPGGGSSPEMRRFFDPDIYRIILFDQRGCGRSTPHSELEENDTWALVSDMEAIREMLGIDKWVVFGGSWGSTLALSYAVEHTDRVHGLILRGIFLITEAEIQWFYQDGASRLFPDAYDRYIAPIPEEERGDLLHAFHRRLTGEDRKARTEAAKAWACWEGETISIQGPSSRPARFEEDSFADAFARIECHYFVNKGFFPEDGWLLKKAKEKLKGVPGIIVHGRYDVVTPLATAWALTKVWPDASLHIVPDAGHSSLDSSIVDQLIRATRTFGKLFG
ncbi:prolyl aminopeptidase [Henriciella mobilis]|uniref:Proline iminopeptidase n=1 Tax=Henriciella mobilis TaxID=2305467 RepID=A0A399RLF5_9PROT|nr:prolyl aminopeptidase [Henriciella mobilis]RIJ32570.1 prolyl aminopeptidase [Henriciella mobilis]